MPGVASSRWTAGARHDVSIMATSTSPRIRASAPCSGGRASRVSDDSATWFTCRSRRTSRRVPLPSASIETRLPMSCSASVRLESRKNIHSGASPTAPSEARYGRGAARGEPALDETDADLRPGIAQALDVLQSAGARSQLEIHARRAEDLAVALAELRLCATHRTGRHHHGAWRQRIARRDHQPRDGDEQRHDRGAGSEATAAPRAG